MLTIQTNSAQGRHASETPINCLPPATDTAPGDNEPFRYLLKIKVSFEGLNMYKAEVVEK